MSRKVWGIVLSLSAVAIVLAVAIWYLQRNLSAAPEEQQGTELVELEPTEAPPNQVAAEQEPLAQGEGDEGDVGDHAFLLVNEDNYVTVYQLPERELYEYTDLIMDVLPEDVRSEVEEGKYLKDEEELYNFLENYTS